MSENIRGITFAEQAITPADDAIARRVMLGDGILSGCKVTYSGSTLTMAAGYIIACGRAFQITAAQNWAVVDSTSGFARLLATIDLTQTATEATFNQISFSIEYASAEDGFVGLEQEDINISGTKYQIVVAVMSLGAGGITGIVSTLMRFGIGKISMELLWENASPASNFGAQTLTLNLDGYSAIDVVFRAITTRNYYATLRAYLNGQIYECLDSDGAGFMVTREVEKTAGGLRFGNGYKYDSYAKFSQNTSVMIPYQVYGIKGVSA